jgi:hypothetical protein
MVVLPPHLSNMARLGLVATRAIDSVQLRFKASDEAVLVWFRDQIRLFSNEEYEQCRVVATQVFFDEVRAKLPATAAPLLPRRAARVRDLVVALDGHLDRELASGTPDVFERVVDCVRTAVGAVYAEATGSAAGVPNITVIPRMNKVHDLQCNLYLSGHTEPGPPREVELNAQITAVDDNTIAAASYVLFHELICHGLAGAVPSGPLTCDTASPFSEGFMDYVANRLHEQALEHPGGNRKFQDCLADPEASLLSGRDYQAARYFAEAQPGQPDQTKREVDRRRIGRKLAAHIERLFVRAKLNPPFETWAIRVNSLELTHEERDDFATAIDLATSRLPQGDPDRTEEDALAAQLAAFGTPADITGWTNGILDS